MTQYSGKVIRKTPVTPTQQSASGVWKLNEQAAAIRNNSWPVPGVPDPISRSLRFRASASAYLNRTPSASNRTTWTWSGWVKLGSLSAYDHIFMAYQGSSPSDTNYFRLFMPGPTSNQLQVGGGTTNWLVTTQVFRDPSAWYHIVLAVDTTQATASNRLKLYANGSQIKSFATASYPAQNSTLAINANWGHYIGTEAALGNYFDGYMTEINFIDGQALTPSSFGTTDTATGAWIPMPYTGTYGTNGFYLNFKDNTSTTTLGYDYSGNANNWNTNNISLTSGVTYDSMLDVPTPWVGYSTTTDTSAVTRGNYSVMNPLRTSSAILTNGNLYVAQNTTAYVSSTSTFGMKTGKWYWEVTIVSASAQVLSLGIANSNSVNGLVTGIWTYHLDGTKYIGSSNSAYGSGYNTNGVVVGFAFDADAGTLTCYRNNVSQGTLVSGLAADTYYAYATMYNSTTVAYNFGQSPLSYSPPSGYKTLVTTNLPTPTITNGANYMAASTYTGNGTSQSIVNSGNNTAAVSFKPDLVWAKPRNQAWSNNLFDSVRGVGLTIRTDSTGAEGTYAGISSFNSNGFTVQSGADTNGSGTTIVAWQWKAGGTPAVTNTSGSITSTVSANTTAGFSVVTYTGTGANATVGHGLGVAPSLIILKTRNSADNWPVWHGSFAVNEYVYLNLTNAKTSLSTFMNSTLPSSTVISLGTWANTNTNGTTMVAYCWAAVAGYSAFGSYTGNGSTDGPFVYCGFRPRYVLVKRSDASTTNWVMVDSSRDTYNVEANRLWPNLSNAESATALMDFTANGFKIRNTNADENTSGATYIFAAFAENPFKYSNAR